MKTLFGSRGRAATVLGGIGTLLMGTCVALVLGGGTAHAAGAAPTLTVNSATRDCSAPTTPTIGFTASGLTVGTPYATRLLDPSDPSVQADGSTFTPTSTSYTTTDTYRSTFGETPIGSGAQNLTLQLGDVSVVGGFATFKTVASAPVSFASCSAPPPPVCTDVANATFTDTIAADGSATVKLTNGPLCSAVNVYEAAYQGVTTGPPSSTNPQTLTGSDGPTALQQPGDTANFKVTPPLCNGQIDLITAAPQATLTSDYYTSHNQLIDASNETTVCTTTSTTPPPVTTSSPPPVTTSSAPPKTTSTAPVTTATTSSSTAVAVPSSNTPSLGVKYVTDDYGTLPSSNRYMTLALVLGVVGLLCMIGSAVTLKASRPTRRH